ncbi:MAG: MMPL family transporter [Actinomycetales bacterium]|nr:MMPL family transporter [Actinomycetales bacterium]
MSADSRTGATSGRIRTGRLAIWGACAVIIGWLAIGGIAGQAFGMLTSVQENDNASFLPADSESTRVNALSALFTDGSDSLPALVLLTSPNLAAASEGITELVAGLPALPLAALPGQTLGDYLVPGQQITPIPSPDGEAVLIALPLAADAVLAALPDGERPLLVIVEQLRETLTELPSVAGYVTGPGGLLADLFGAFGEIDTTLLLAALAVVAIILIFVYRSPALWILPLFSALIALATAGALVYLLARADIVTLNGQSQGILFVLVIGAATDYALLLIARYREELHHHRHPYQAMAAAWRGVVEPIVASGSTAALGLLVLLASELNTNRSTGPVAAIGIVAAMLVMLTLLPALLVVGGRWLFWPRIPQFDDADDTLSGGWARVARLIGRRPRLAWIASALILVIAGGFAFRLDTSGVDQGEILIGAPDSVAGQEALAVHFPGGTGTPTLVIAPAGDIAAVTSALTAQPGVESVAPTRLGPVIPGQPEPPVRVEQGLVQLEVTTTEAPDTAQSRALIPVLREAVQAASPEALVGGFTAVSYDTQESSTRDRNLIIPIVLLVILVILILLLRSLLAPVLLLATVVLSFLATLGVSHVVFTHILGPLLDSPGFLATDASFPLFAFVFLVALGIDYNIFLMTRVREESLRLGTRPGILKGLTVTGGVITSAGIVLAATFAVLGVLPLVFLAQIGFAVSFGVLLDTFLVRSFLVPALAYDIGRRVWWPSRLARAPQP